ncbi:bifunctional tetrahydrofolate synthase/dihydrofolate synthase [Buchnera aphidicola]|uniref:bifunctional tetrahydrofolate synthase/dihydrofolate synthase n=1 Tax=Buchnera aphidicola TaxID=9 RepID=UPI003464CECC
MQQNQYNKYTSLRNWLSYIKNNSFIHDVFSLEKVIFIAKKLNLLQKYPFIITVAGTNGKGSTSTLLEQIFLDAGYRVGLYTSPHLLYFYERVRINGNTIKNSIIFTTAFEQVELVRGNILLTFFEFITLASFLIFKSFFLDILILEVGIGGRLDATNIFDPNIAVITNIDLDHTLLLGNTRNAIGLEKTGILRYGIPVFYGDIDIPDSVYHISQILKISLNRIPYEWNWNKNINHWNFFDQYGALKKLFIPRIKLSNAAVAIAVARSTNFNVKSLNIVNALKKITLPGRFHIIFYNPYIILDVAHNVNSGKYLLKKLKEFLKSKNNITVYGIIGMSFNKDIKNFISNFLDVIDIWCSAPLKNPRAVSVNILKTFLPKHSIFFLNINQILSVLLKTVNPKDVILVFGSFLIVSEVIKFMRDKFFKK